MDKSSVIGLIIAFIALLTGMVMKGVSLTAFYNPAAILIIIFGTISAVTIAFPMQELKRVPKLFKILFKETKLANDIEIIKMFSQWADLARREGLLALESKASEIEDPFLKNGLTLAIDGQNADYIRDVLTEEVEAMEERHASGSAIFTQAGTYAPTLGVLGAVVGLIAALALEVKQKRMMIEGILSVLEGEAPRVIEQKLSSYLTMEERRQISVESGAGGLGKES